jgi:hypothetical protein
MIEWAAYPYIAMNLVFYVTPMFPVGAVLSRLLRKCNSAMDQQSRSEHLSLR